MIGTNTAEVDSPELHNGHEVHVIGQAAMESDGTIVEDLFLRDEKLSLTGMKRKILKPRGAKYKPCIEHMGGLKPGQSKAVKNDWD